MKLIEQQPTMPNRPPFFSIVIPVYNGGQAFVACLQAITRSNFRDWELIVVDDGSSDDSALVAQSFGAKLLQTQGRWGAGAARNLGAKAAQGEYLCFIDADCEAYPDTLSRLAEALKQDPHLGAIFGSYDDAPKAENFVAQFKNLMHHYTHQVAQTEATTFWTGCGAVRRSLFLRLGGFDAHYIEDIHLGYRIRQTGSKIHLVKQAQVKHHKAWKLAHLIKVDVWERGVPWTRLLLEQPERFRSDLNLTNSSRISVVAVYSLLPLLPLALGLPQVAGLLLVPILTLLWLNREFYQFFYHKRGLLFTVQAVLMHWLYYGYSGVAFGLGLLLHKFQPVTSRRPRVRRVLKRLVGLSDVY